jgi:hypothetical protein
LIHSSSEILGVSLPIPGAYDLVAFYPWTLDVPTDRYFNSPVTAVIWVLTRPVCTGSLSIKSSDDIISPLALAYFLLSLLLYNSHIEWFSFRVTVATDSSRGEANQIVQSKDASILT